MGGLAAVSAALPRALRSLSDVRIILPGYRDGVAGPVIKLRAEQDASSNSFCPMATRRAGTGRIMTCASADLLPLRPNWQQALWTILMLQSWNERWGS